MNHSFSFAIRRTLEGMRDPVFSSGNTSWGHHIEDIGYLLEYCDNWSCADESKVLYSIRPLPDGIIIAMIRRMANGRAGDNLTAWVHVPWLYIHNRDYVAFVVDVVRNQLLALYLPDDERVRLAETEIILHGDEHFPHNIESVDFSLVPDGNGNVSCYTVVDSKTISNWPRIFDMAIAKNLNIKELLVFDGDKGMFPAPGLPLRDFNDLWPNDKVSFNIQPKSMPSVCCESSIAIESPAGSVVLNGSDTRWKWLMALGVLALVAVLLTVLLLPKDSDSAEGNPPLEIVKIESSDYFEYFEYEEAIGLIYLDSARVWRRSEMERIDYLRGLFDRIDTIDRKMLSSSDYIEKYLFSDVFMGEVVPALYDADWVDSYSGARLHLSADGETINLDNLADRMRELRNKAEGLCDSSAE